MEIIIDLVRSIGNAIAKYIFRKGLIEENSVLSDGMGIIFIIAVAYTILMAIVSFL